MEPGAPEKLTGHSQVHSHTGREGQHWVERGKVPATVVQCGYGNLERSLDNLKEGPGVMHATSGLKGWNGGGQAQEHDEVYQGWWHHQKEQEEHKMQGAEGTGQWSPGRVPNSSGTCTSNQGLT